MDPAVVQVPHRHEREHPQFGRIPGGSALLGGGDRSRGAEGTEPLHRASCAQAANSGRRRIGRSVIRTVSTVLIAQVGPGLHSIFHQRSESQVALRQRVAAVKVEKESSASEKLFGATAKRNRFAVYPDFSLNSRSRQAKYSVI